MTEDEFSPIFNIVEYASKWSEMSIYWVNRRFFLFFFSFDNFPYSPKKGLIQVAAILESY